MFTRDVTYEVDVERRIANDSGIRWQTISTCFAVHNAVLLPKLFYGSETYVLQKKNERKMNAVEISSLRRVFEVSLTN